jgi:Holliday junction resolvase RusA-like endonuclease
MEGKPDPPYSVYYHFRFKDLRRRDVNNYIKVLEDAIFEGLGIDDRHVIDSHQFKYVSRNDPGFVCEIRHSSRGIEV